MCVLERRHRAGIDLNSGNPMQSEAPAEQSRARVPYQVGIQGPGKVAIRPYLSEGPTSWPGASLPRWSRPGARFQQQACSDILMHIADFAGTLIPPCAAPG